MANDLMLMDDDKTPAEFQEEENVAVEPTVNDEIEGDNHERTVIDPGLLAEFMAAHPEDHAAQTASPPAAAPAVKQVAAAQEQKDVANSFSVFSSDDEPVEGKTSIASLADIQAMSTAEPAPLKEESTPVEEIISENAKSKLKNQENANSIQENTTELPVEKVVSALAEPLPKKHSRRKPAVSADMAAEPISRPAATAQVEEMEDVWNSFDEQDMGEWSARSAEHPVPVVDKQNSTNSQLSEEKNISATTGGIKEDGRLICLGGEFHGREYPLTAAGLTIGRQDGNTITIRDQSLSRHHASISKKDGVFTITDNNSSNGTFVNGLRVTQTVIHGGDEIVFGNIPFRFMDLNAPPKSQPVAQGQVVSFNRVDRKPGPSSKPPKRLIMAAMGLAMVVAIIMGLAINKLRNPQNDQIDAEQIRQLYHDGVAAFKGRKWNDSLRHFVTLSQLEPGSQLTKRYLLRIKVEADVEQRLTSIQETINKGLLAEAFEMLSNIPDETVYVAEYNGLKGQIDAESQKELAKINVVIDGDAVADALPLLEAAAQKLPSTYKNQLAALTASANDKIEAAKNKANTSNKVIKTGGGRRGDNIESKAVNLFNERKITAALRLLESQGAPNQSAPAELVFLHRQISKFDEIYQQARVEWQSKNVEEAITILRQALSLNKKISNNKSPYTGELKHWLADMLFIKGHKEYSSKKYPSAYQLFYEALQLYPDHSQSRNKLNEMSEMVDGWYKQAYIIKGTDPTKCKAILNQVIRTVNNTDPVYGKAKDLLSTIP